MPRQELTHDGSGSKGISMTTFEQSVEEAKALGEQTMLMEVSEKDAGPILAQAEALGIRGYKIAVDESEFSDLNSRSRPTHFTGGIIDLSPSEIEALIMRDGLPHDPIATHPRTVLFFVF